MGKILQFPTDRGVPSRLDRVPSGGGSVVSITSGKRRAMREAVLRPAAAGYGRWLVDDDDDF